MRKTTSFLTVALALAALTSGCALAHRYPAYRGKVLELGTDQPIEGAGVLAVYRTWQAGIGETLHPYLGYQATLSGAEGRFDIPAKTFFTFRPMGRFDPKVRITIYKAGYGNFPGSIGGKYTVKMAKQGKTDPELPRGFWFPPETEVTIWLPKLTTEEERKEHDWLFVSPLPSHFHMDEGFPPPGMHKNQFLPPIYLLKGEMP